MIVPLIKNTNESVFFDKLIILRGDS